jgi:hypothetical protein
MAIILPIAAYGLVDPTVDVGQLLLDLVILTGLPVGGLELTLYLLLGRIVIRLDSRRIPHVVSIFQVAELLVVGILLRIISLLRNQVSTVILQHGGLLRGVGCIRGGASGQKAQNRKGQMSG